MEADRSCIILTVIVCRYSDELLLHDLHEAISNCDGVIAIEWSEKIKRHLPEKHTDIYFEYVDENVRKIMINPAKREQLTYD